MSTFLRNEPDLFVMYVTIKQFVALSLNTLLGVIRQPLVLLMTTAFLILAGLLPLVGMFNLGEEGKLVRDGALAFHFVFGLLLASASASAALFREIRSGRAAIVLSKPVSRELFFLATYCGVVLTLLLFSMMAMITTLFSVRMAMMRWELDGVAVALFFGALLAAFGMAAVSNFRFKTSFVSGAFLLMLPALLMVFLVEACRDPAGHFCPLGTFIQWRVVPASILISMALLVLASIAVSLSTRLSPVFTMALCSGLFFLGLISDYLLGQTRECSLFADVFYRVLPNWQDFWMVDALTGGGSIPWSYVAMSGVYAGLYLTAVLGLGLISFRSVEIH